MRRRYPQLAQFLGKPWSDLYPTLATVLVEARNVSNVPRIEEFIKELEKKAESDKVKKWLKSNLRNYLIRDHESVVKLDHPLDTDPEWMKKAIQEGKEVFEVQWDDAFRNKIEHVIDFLNSDAAPERLERLVVPEALKQSDEWTKQLQKKKIDEKAEEGEEIAMKFPDGFTWRKLVSEASLAREGKLMGHCVGGYWRYVQPGHVAIYSLRDQKNEPHCTIEVRPEQKHVMQIKGKGNAPVVEKYHPYVKDLLEQELKGHQVEKRELENAGLYQMKDGQILDRKTLDEASRKEEKEVVASPSGKWMKLDGPVSTVWAEKLIRQSSGGEVSGTVYYMLRDSGGEPKIVVKASEIRYSNLIRVIPKGESSEQYAADVLALFQQPEVQAVPFDYQTLSDFDVYQADGEYLSKEQLAEVSKQGEKLIAEKDSLKWIQAESDAAKANYYVQMHIIPSRHSSSNEDLFILLDGDKPKMFIAGVSQGAVTQAVAAMEVEKKHEKAAQRFVRKMFPETGDLPEIDLYRLDDKLVSKDEVLGDKELVEKILRSEFGLSDPLANHGFEVTEEGVRVTMYPDEAVEHLPDLDSRTRDNLRNTLEGDFTPDFEMRSEGYNIDDMIEGVEKVDALAYQKIKKAFDAVAAQFEDLHEYRAELPKIYEAAVSGLADGYHVGTQDAAYEYVTKKLSNILFDSGSYTQQADKNKIALILTPQAIVNKGHDSVLDEGALKDRDGFDYRFFAEAATERFLQELRENEFLKDDWG